MFTKIVLSNGEQNSYQSNCPDLCGTVPPFQLNHVVPQTSGLSHCFSSSTLHSRLCPLGGATSVPPSSGFRKRSDKSVSGSQERQKGSCSLTICELTHLSANVRKWNWHQMAVMYIEPPLLHVYPLVSVGTELWLSRLTTEGLHHASMMGSGILKPLHSSIQVLSHYCTEVQKVGGGGTKKKDICIVDSIP